jgi:hypothetical protein
VTLEDAQSVQRQLADLGYRTQLTSVPASTPIDVRQTAAPAHVSLEVWMSRATSIDIDRLSQFVAEHDLHYWVGASEPWWTIQELAA